MRREPDARIVNDIATAARPGRVLRSCARRRATSFAMAPLRDGGLGASLVQATERSDAAVLIDQLGARRKPGIASRSAPGPAGTTRCSIRSAMTATRWRMVGQDGPKTS